MKTDKWGRNWQRLVGSREIIFSDERYCGVLLIEWNEPVKREEAMMHNRARGHLLKW